MSKTIKKKKEKFSMEFEIKSSTKSLYTHLSTASGLEEWFADKVTLHNGDYLFHWEGSEQLARMVSHKENLFVKYKWIVDGEKDDTFFQFDIMQDEITGDVALIVTDFTTPEEKEEDMLLWSSQVHQLMHALGT